MASFVVGGSDQTLLNTYDNAQEVTHGVSDVTPIAVQCSRNVSAGVVNAGIRDTSTTSVPYVYDIVTSAGIVGLIYKIP